MIGVSGLLKQVRLANKAAALASAVSLLLLGLVSGGAFGFDGPPSLVLAVMAMATSLGLAAVLSQVKRLSLLQQAVKFDQKTLVDRASHDDLTGCLTRRRFLEILDERLAAMRSASIQRRTSEDLTLMLIDVDHFKMLNDGFGHPSGDLVLQTLGRCARAERGWITGRLGGDEFAILVPGSDHREIADQARRFTERLTEEMRRNESTRAFHGVSIGVACAPLHADHSRDLLQKADIALYVGKRNGRGQVTFYHGHMERAHAEQRHIARELHAALLLDQLDLHYQPIMGPDGKPAAAEALVRWRNGLGGSMAPDKFIPVAEQSDLIDRLGEWVFRRACRDLKESGYPRISVNISGAQLKHDRLVPMLRRVLRDTGCDARDFTLEITETVVLKATHNVMAILRELREMGFLIALDDFGTGNNSFSLLRNMPVDIIKIDKSYTQRVEDDKIAQVFVSAVCEIAKALNMIVVAEGIETEAQHTCARLAGAQRFQGWLHGRPEPLKRPAASTGQISASA